MSYGTRNNHTVYLKRFVYIIEPEEYAAISTINFNVKPLLVA